MMLSGSMGVLTFLLLVLFVGVPLLVLAGVAIWLVVKNTGTAGKGKAAAETPREVLDRRLAAGEIDIEEYRRILSELGGQDTP